MAKDRKVTPPIATTSRPITDNVEMPDDTSEAAPGTTDQRPRWEGPSETRPRGYLPALDDPKVDTDAAGENLQNPERDDVSLESFGAHRSREDRVRARAFRLWEEEGEGNGSHEDHWHRASREIDDEEA